MARPAGKRVIPLSAMRAADSGLISGLALRWLISGESTHTALSVAEQVAARIGSLIIEGTYPSGARLHEEDLAGALGVSRAPIREALRILEREGLVRIITRRGAQVAPLSAAELQDLFEIRIVLFGRLARRAAAERDAALLDEIEQSVIDLERRVRSSQFSGTDHALATFRITFLMARACRNKRLSELVVSHALRTLRYTMLGLQSTQRRRRSAQNWRELVDSLRSGSEQATQARVEQLITAGAEAAVAALKTMEKA